MRRVPAADELELGRPARGPAARSSKVCVKAGQSAAQAGGGLNSPSGVERIGGLRDPVEQARGGGRTDAGQQLNDAEAGDPVARVLGPAQKGQHVLDVGGLEELETAEFHERDVAARQLDLERRRCGARRETAPPAA